MEVESETPSAKKRLAQLELLLEKAQMYSQFISGELQHDTYIAPNSNSEKDEDEDKAHAALTQPPLLTGGEIKTYQRSGLNWLIQLFENGMNGILADEMGLGKTVQTIALLSHLWGKGVTGPFLIVAPVSTLANWMNELGKWAPSLPALLYHGSKDERAQMREKFGSKKVRSANGQAARTPLPVLVTSFDIAINDSGFLQKHTWKYLVVDEAHRLKNFECKLIQELKVLQTENRLLLTGTPLQNSLAELWSLLNFILPDIFDNLENFKAWFDFDAHHEETALNQLVSKLHTIIRPFMLRRLKREVEPVNIAQKREVIVYCPLTPMQRAFYQLIFDRDWTQLSEAGQLAQNKMRMLNAVMQLRKVCNHPALFDELFDEFYDKYLEAQRLGTSVFALLEQERAARELLQQNQQSGYLRKRKRVGYSEESYFSAVDSILEDSSASSNPQLQTIFNEGDQEAFFKFMADQRKELSTRVAKNEKFSDVAVREWGLLDASKRQDFSSSTTTTLPTKQHREYQHLKTEADHLNLIQQSSGKIEVLSRLLPALKERGHKVLVFSQMTRVLDILETFVEAVPYKYCRIDGSTSQRDRQAEINRFREDNSVFLFLLSTRAGGIGINLTAADTVILFDSDWNPQMDLQAQDRAHRIGQTKPVAVFRLVTPNTVESRIISTAAKKLRLERLVVSAKVEKSLNFEEMTTILGQSSESQAAGEAQLSANDLKILADRQALMQLLSENQAIQQNLPHGIEIVDQPLAEF